MNIDNNLLQKIKEFAIIEEDYPLADLSTFKIGGPAKYLCRLNNLKTIPLFWQLIKQYNIPHYFLGGGSNILISDQGCDSLIVKLDLNKLEVLRNTIVASADIALVSLVSSALGHQLTGLEFAVGIPGSVGGAVVGNAGAYGGQISDSLIKCLILDEDCQIQSWTKDKLNFKYRDSILKHRDLLLLEATFELVKGDSEQIKQKMVDLNNDRWSKQPAYPSAGSVFKNILLTPDILITLQQRLTQPIPQQYLQYGKLPAGWLIELAGLKGKNFGGAQISDKHANFIINFHQATAQDVLTAIKFIKQTIFNLYNIQLEEEIRYLGF